MQLLDYDLRRTKNYDIEVRKDGSKCDYVIVCMTKVTMTAKPTKTVDDQTITSCRTTSGQAKADVELDATGVCDADEAAATDGYNLSNDYGT